MKVMKKIWTAIFAFIFTIALGLGISLSVNVTAKAATAQDVSLTWAAIHSENGAPTKYAFVLNEGITTPENYEFDVYFDGHRVPAYTIAGHNVIYVDYADFPSDVNDVHLFKLPAGTYYQSGAYTSTDCTLLLKNAGWDNGADRFDILTYERISDASFGFGLNMVDWALGANNNSAIYTAIEGGSVIPYGGNGSDENWDVQYASVGNAVFVNGVAANATIIKTHATELAYLAIPAVANAGDTVTVDGWFMNANNNKAFCIEETTFKFDGQAWGEVGVTQEYDLVLSTTVNGGHERGIYASMAPNDIPVNSEDTWKYQTKACGGAKGILYNGTAINACLHKWSVGDWYVNLDAVGISAKAGDVVTVFGWFFCVGDGSTQNHIKINPTTFTFDGTTWSQENAVISVSLNNTAVETQQLYVMPGESVNAISATATGSMLTDKTVTTVYENGAVKDGKFVLRDGESSSTYAVTFSVKDKNNVVYKKEMAVRVGFEDFVMENGAAVRTEKDSVNGLRFSAEMSADTYNNLTAQGATFGMVIVPKDYITEGYELTAINLFGANAKYSATAAVGANQDVRRMLLLDNLTPANRDTDGNYEIYGAITDILTNNLTREFVGIAYVYVDETYILASYCGNEMENNTRSIYYVAQKAIDADDNAKAVQTKYIDEFHNYVEDAGATYKVSYTINYVKTANGMTTTETETVKAELNETVELQAKEFDGFTLTSAAMLTSKLYANKPNVFNFYYKDSSAPSYDSVAWYYPALDSSNGYDNAHNDAIAQTMKAAGFTTVNLAGKNNININSETNVEAMKQIIAMFNRNGLKSVVYTSNATNSEMFGNTTLPDFSDCAGFAGLLVWDEPLPTTAAMNRLAEYAVWFNEVYGESTEEIPFMVNLFPSYASCFEDETGDYTTYAAYIEAYCDEVLSAVNGTKYLSTDTYPIMADGTLKENFLYDLAVLKAYGMDYDAFVHVCLQSSGWNTGNTTQAKAPTEEQMRLQLYTALAFGMDSVSWYTYSPSNDAITDQTPVDFAGNKNEAVYNAMQAVNGDIATIGSLYKTYDWKGVIMSSPAKGGLFGSGRDAQYNAYNKVKNESVFAKYLLSASNTKNFSSVSGSGNYIIGVMEDKNGNEAFTVVNYSAIKDNKALSLTLKATETANYTIYVDGVAREVTIGTSGYTLNLQPGQGAFIVSANVKATVTFKNWDGTVLQSDKVAYGETPVYTGATPTKDGYEFTGWSPAIGAVTRDVTYTAQFAQRHTVTFKNYDGAVIGTKSVLGGDRVETITLTHDTYIFKAWTLNGVEYDFNTAVTEDITLVAKWCVLTAITPTTETVASNAMASVTTNATKESDKLVMTGAANNTYTFTLPTIQYFFYNEVSMISVFGGGNTGYTFSAYGTNFVNTSTAWNWFKVVRVGAEGKTVKNTDTGSDLVLSEGYYLTIGNTDIGSEWYKYVKLSDAVVNGEEGLTFSVMTNNGAWDWVRFRQDGGVETDNFAGVKAYALKDVGWNTVVFTNMVGEDITQNVFTGNQAEQLAEPIRAGYIFGGWYTEDGKAFDFDAGIVKDTVVVAKWYTLNPIASTKEIVVNGVSSKITTNGVKEAGQIIMTGAANNTYALTLPQIQYFLYDEVSMITTFGQANTGYTFSAYGTNFVNTSVAWNWFKVVRVGAEGITVKNTDTGADLVLLEGYYLTIGNTDVGAEWYKYVKLSEAVVNGKEGLTFSITTSEGAWDFVKFRQLDETENFVGAKAYALVDIMACNLTEASTVTEYLAYVSKVNGFTAYEKVHYVEPAIVATLRAKYAGTSVTLVSNAMASVTTNAAKETTQLVMTGAADNTYTFTLPTIEYFLYNEVSMITVFGQANTGYTFSACGTNFVNTSTAWNWVKVVKVGAEGKTVKNTETGDDIVLEEGYYLAIGNTDVPDIWYKYVKLSDAVVNGEEGLTFSVTTSDGAWDWIKFRQDGSVETDNFVGKLA